MYTVQWDYSGKWDTCKNFIEYICSMYMQYGNIQQITIHYKLMQTFYKAHASVKGQEILE